MNKISNLIFHDKPHYVTQKFSSTHQATDYGTNRKKINQYAIEQGIVSYVGMDNYGSKFIKVKYPDINKEFLHGHLDKILVKKNESVNESTILGTTGKTGRATGIHLHLAIKDLNSNKYIDPEEYSLIYKKENIYYTVKKGDNLTKIAKQFNTTWQKLYELNKETIGPDPNKIYPNQILLVK